MVLFRTFAANLQCVMFSGVQKTEFCLDLVFENRSAVTKVFSRPSHLCDRLASVCRLWRYVTYVLWLKGAF